MPQILNLLGASGPYVASQRLMGVGPMSQGLSLHLLSADFNENGFIDEEDLQKIVLRLLNSDEISEDLLMDVTHHVLSESDLDNDNMLSFSEFEHAMAKSPDFMKQDDFDRRNEHFDEEER
ncbi:hypothetical protein A6R68_00520 [Neotoma lepida]|uniref:EF-hand domain-containing protein n=1 Tax=Neotoma lepida TaxID=56216 RepID=A0A1A6GY78_NEOLE|nr:hypothetical protein A6R68_00520 [Neotoma lepida]